MTTPGETYVGIDVGKTWLDVAFWGSEETWRVRNDAAGTALLLYHGSLRVLIPGGISLGELRKYHEALQPSLLVLSVCDLKDSSEDHWRQLEPFGHRRHADRGV